MLASADWPRRLATGGCERAPAGRTLFIKRHGISFERTLSRASHWPLGTTGRNEALCPLHGTASVRLTLHRMPILLPLGSSPAPHAAISLQRRSTSEHDPCI